MKEFTRTQNSIKNINSGIMVQIINKIMSFVSRTFFIYYLSTEYLGINGLFSNILSILSFAELGIGSAIVFNLYKPIAENNIEKIKSYMEFYKKSYNIIGCIIFILGVLALPFLNFIIKEPPVIKEKISYIFMLFLLDTSISYFFTYKKSLIIACQKQVIINQIDSIFYFLKNIIQIIILAINRSFYCYLLIQILSTFLENIVIAYRADKMYPYLKEKNIKKLELEESKLIFKNVKSLAIYQFGAVVMNGTDNIIISALIGVKVVGLCSNYSLILNSIKQIIGTGLNGLTASIGNLNASENAEKQEKIYLQLTFLYFLIYSFCSIAFINLIGPFISIWLGKDFILPISVAIVLGINLFIEGIRMPGFMFRTTLGLFEKAKITPYIGAIANIIISILLAKRYGVIGIFIGTGISQLISYFWIDPFLLYKYQFKKSPSIFFKKLLGYCICFVVEIVLTLNLGKIIKTSLLIKIILNFIIVLVLPNTINFIIFLKTKEFQDLKNRFLKMF